MDRRALIFRGLAAPIVYGLTDLFQEEPPPPAWLTSAYARMKSTGQPGLVLIVPEQTDKLLAVADALERVLRSPERRLRELGRRPINPVPWRTTLADAAANSANALPHEDLLLDVVWICLREGLAKRLLPRKAHGLTRALLDTDGRVVAGDRHHLAEVLDGFPDDFEVLAHGRRNARLARTVENLQRRLGADMRAKVAHAITTLEGDPADDGARTTLVDAAERIAPWLVLEARRAKSKKHARLLRKILWSLGHASLAKRLPFGVTIPDGCLDSWPDRAVAMSIPGLNPPALKFLDR